ncbi:hypothetical protein [Mesorhizobium sp. CO1-1-8]|uniref:hypothetical protein n=1 Tax=Mesorhizobium sp. CO1-1-8 TaxID=2876631 RepID=UPI001CD0C0F0|nr:hypothetical protein [Mesorhizobium sp. CO1-1-8]MBZ9771564.1 hypothetical protein [Mesorhizobium sp. CO1-1-8]
MQSNVSLDQFGRWSGGVAAAAMAATPEELSARFTAAASGLVGSDRVYVGFYHRDITSLTIDDAGPDHWNRDYDAHIYRQDPFFQRFASTRQDFLLPLSALRNGDFQHTPYYSEFYGPSDSFDEITGVFNLDGLTAGYVTFLRRNGAEPFAIRIWQRLARQAARQGSFWKDCFICAASGTRAPQSVTLARG